MEKAEFKRRWELNESGDGITFDDVADCAKKWGLFSRPRIHPPQRVLESVLKAAGVEGNF